MNTITGDKPGYYCYDDIYHPGDTRPNLVLPAVGSTIVDDRDPNNPHLLYVASRDKNALTYTSIVMKAEALSPDFDSGDDNDTWNISDVDYGNNKLYMYYTEESIQNNGAFKLTFDDRIVVLGDDVSFAQVVKTDVDGNIVPVSMNFDSSGNYKNNRVELTKVNIDGELDKNVFSPTNSHTTTPIDDNDVFRLIVYDYAGVQTGEFKLFAKRALINNDAQQDQMIIGFILEATQQDTHGLYLTPGQDKKALNVIPKLVFSDGRTVAIPIDGSATEIYGLNEFIASSTGQETEVLVKYWLHPNDQAYGDFVHVVGNSRYLAVTERLRVVDIPESLNCKLSVVPRYNHQFSKWYLTFFLYTIGRNDVYNVTPLINVDDFDGGEYTRDQELNISFDLSEIYPEVTIEKHYQQYLKIRLAPPLEEEKYITQNSPNDIYGQYGVVAMDSPRPTIVYYSATQKYCIPLSKFIHVEYFLESFYYKARPLYETSASLVPIKPNKFRIRDIATNKVIAGPILVDQYYSDWTIDGLNPDLLNGTNCIVEFLSVVDDVTTVLYGVPVDVIPVENL